MFPDEYYLTVLSFCLSFFYIVFLTHCIEPSFSLVDFFLDKQIKMIYR